MWKAAPGSLRSEACGGFFDKGKFARAKSRSMAVSRSAAGRQRRAHHKFGRRIHAARARFTARRAVGIGPTVYKRRRPESDPEFQSPRDGGGSFDGPRVGREKTGGAFGR